MVDEQGKISKIIGFHQDDEHHWVADLSCGHTQHMRHQPPWMIREWVLTKEGREAKLGIELTCTECESVKIPE